MHQTVDRLQCVSNGVGACLHFRESGPANGGGDGRGISDSPINLTLPPYTILPGHFSLTDHGRMVH